MKKILKNRIFIVIITMIICISGTLYATTNYKASEVIYNASSGETMNVNDALNELYLKKKEKNAIISKVALSTPSRGTYTIDVANFIKNNNLEVNYTELTNNNFGYERQDAYTNTAGDSIAAPSYSYDASTGILKINNPLVNGSGRLFSNGVPYLYYIVN